MRRYLKVLFLQSRATFLATLEYRVSYLFRIFRILLSIGLVFVTLDILFLRSKTLGNWNRSEVFLIFSLYQFVSSFIDFFCGDSLNEIPSLVRQGDLDIILLKPLDAQFLISFRQIHPGNIYRILTSLGIFYYAASLLKERITAGQFFLGLFFILAAVVIFYSLLLLIASASFYVLEESLAELFENFLSISRYPIDIFPKGLRILLTVIPVVFLVTVPSMVILGKFSFLHLSAFPVAIFLFYFSRRCFLKALRDYTSAGG